MDEEGFAEEEAESLIVPKQDILEHFTTSLTVQHKNKIKNREPRLSNSLTNQNSYSYPNKKTREKNLEDQ